MKEKQIVIRLRGQEISATKKSLGLGFLAQKIGNGWVTVP